MLMLIPARDSNRRDSFAKINPILVLVLLERKVQVALHLSLLGLQLRVKNVAVVKFERLHQRHVVRAQHLVVGLRLLGVVVGPSHLLQE